MAGQLDSLFKSVAKSVVATLGDSFDHTISYTKKGVSSYNVDTGEQVTVDTTYSDLKVPISFVRSEEEAECFAEEFMSRGMLGMLDFDIPKIH